ncbi:MAG TPA: hypothetical protein VF275_10815 [Gammaproteobacteria bacterium]
MKATIGALLLVLFAVLLPGALVAGELAERQFVEIGLIQDPEVASLRFGAARAPVFDVRYRDALDPESLRVFLGEKDITSLFNPRTAMEEQVMLPLQGGENVLHFHGVVWLMDESSGRYTSRTFEQKLVIHRVIGVFAQAALKAAEPPPRPAQD